MIFFLNDTSLTCMLIVHIFFFSAYQLLSFISFLIFPIFSNFINFFKFLPRHDYLLTIVLRGLISLVLQPIVMKLLPGMVLYACYAYLSSIYFTCQTICIMCGDIVVVMIYMAMNNLES